MVQDKRSRERCRSWTVLHTQCTSVLSSGFPISQGNAEALDRWGWKTKHLLISYFLGNTFAKNYRNWITYVKTITSHKWTFLRHSVDRRKFITKWYPSTACVSIYAVGINSKSSPWPVHCGQEISPNFLRRRTWVNSTADNTDISQSQA